MLIARMIAAGLEACFDATVRVIVMEIGIKFIKELIVFFKIPCTKEEDIPKVGLSDIRKSEVVQAIPTKIVQMAHYQKHVGE